MSDQGQSPAPNPEPSISGGRCLEDFVVGAVYRHPLGRTITAVDNSWFTQLTLNSNPLHFDSHYAARTRFRRPLVNSTLTLALVTGLSVRDVSQNAVANLGWDDVRLLNPVFEGDTLYAQSEVLEARASRSRPEAGLVSVRTTGYNQDGEVVITFRRTMMIYRRGFVPEPPAPRQLPTEDAP
jgi:acyl dehydratase